MSASEVAIIGAGLSGLALAIGLHQQGIPCTVYESRPDEPINIGGAVMLSPNSLRVLDKLGAYSFLRTRGYNFKFLQYRQLPAELSSPQDIGTVTETQDFGDDAKYGYDGLRIYRTELINHLLHMLEERGIPIKYGRKFARIAEETDDGVRFEWADGTTQTAALVVGADGIHSTVRKYLYPDLKTTFTGMAGITAAVPTAQLEAPAGLHMPVTFVHPTKAGFTIAPQGVDGSEVLIGKQRKVADMDRDAWAAFTADKEDQVRFLQAGLEEAFPALAANAARRIDRAKINVWPFYVVPKLDAWASDRKRVVILGDAAHAIPPSAGQGINQAFEDVYMFGKLLGAARSRAGASSAGGGDGELMRDALRFWQSYRQTRVDHILELNKQIDLRRLPRGEAEVERMDFDYGWLYNADFDKVVENFLDGGKAEDSVKVTL